MTTKKTTNGIVSVIIPTYNREKYIVNAIESIMRDPYKKVEIIIVDDGSTDRTNKLIGRVRSFASTPIKYLHIQHSGAAVARNAGMLVSKGEYTLFLDSDDFLINGKLAKSVQYFNANSDLQVVYSDWYVQNRNGSRQFVEANHANVKNIIRGNFNYFILGMQSTSPLWRRSYLKRHNIWWDEELICWQEPVFGFRAISKLGSTERIRHLSEPLYVMLYEGQDRIGHRKYSDEYVLSELRAYRILYTEAIRMGRGEAVKGHYALHLKQLLKRCLAIECKTAWRQVLQTLNGLGISKKAKLLSMLPFEFILFIQKRAKLLPAKVCDSYYWKLGKIRIKNRHIEAT